MAWLFPDGILFDGFVYKILPGGYAVIGKCRTLFLCLVPVGTQVMLTLPLFSLSWERSCSSHRCCQPHCLHSSDLLRADRSDCPHPANDGGRHSCQHGGSEFAAKPLRQHHPSEETPLFTRLGLEPNKVLTTDQEGRG